MKKGTGAVAWRQSKSSAKETWNSKEKKGDSNSSVTWVHKE